MKFFPPHWSQVTQYDIDNAVADGNVQALAELVRELLPLAEEGASIGDPKNEDADVGCQECDDKDDEISDLEQQVQDLEDEKKELKKKIERAAMELA